MKTVIVTGGAGFIGSCFVRMAIHWPETTIIVLDKLTYAGNVDSLPPIGTLNYHFVQGDISDREVVSDVFQTFQPSSIINFAAESHVDRSMDGPMEFVQTNVIGTCELLEASLDYWRTLQGAARADFRYLQISTDEVYGSLGTTGKFSENTPYSPNSPYSASKAAADHFVRAYHQTYGLPTLITNSSNNYGPYQFPEKLIPLMILNALEGKPLPVYGDGRHIRDWLFVGDHCRALSLVLEKGKVGEVYNIGGGNERSNLEVVQAICDMVDQLRPDLPHIPSRQLVTFVPDRPGHDRRYAIDSTRIQTELGWTPTTSFDDGLRLTVRWYLDNSRWLERLKTGAYRQRLGLGRKGSNG